MSDRKGGQAPGGGAPSSGVYLSKALASLAGAEIELANGLFNNTVNRAYYACYQAGVAALVADGVVPDLEGFWPHDVVHAEFARLLVDTRGRYPRALRTTLKAVFDERLKADYEPDGIGAETAREAVHRARELVQAVNARVGDC